MVIYTSNECRGANAFSICKFYKSNDDLVPSKNVKCGKAKHACRDVTQRMFNSTVATLHFKVRYMGDKKLCRYDLKKNQLTCNPRMSQFFSTLKSTR